MSAVLDDRPHWRPMTVLHLDAVMAVEHAAYAVPWTRGNFIDAIAAGYEAWLLVDPQEALLGYFVAMDGVDEMHLLNLTVAPAHQGHGLARTLLDQLVRLCRERGALSLWLEVRESNQRARRLYERCGFTPIRVRKGYYPLPAGQAGREDATVMSLEVPSA